MLKRRQIDGSTRCVLELGAILEHRTLADDPSKKPFFQLHRRQRDTVISTFSNIHVDDIEFDGIEATSDIRKIAVALVQVTQMAVGLAASLTDDPYAASVLVDQLTRTAKSSEKDARLFAAIISDKARTAATHAIRQGDWDALGKLIEILSRRCGRDYGALVTLSYATFLIDRRNPQRALQFADEAGEVCSDEDGTWRYNKAFLLAELRRYKESLKEYDGIASRHYPEEGGTVSQAADFFLHELKRHPRPIHVEFTLALVYWMKRRTDAGMRRRAKKHFQNFLKLATAPEYEPFVRRARACLDRIRHYDSRRL